MYFLYDGPARSKTYTFSPTIWFLAGAGKNVRARIKATYMGYSYTAMIHVLPEKTFFEKVYDKGSEFVNDIIDRIKKMYDKPIEAVPRRYGRSTCP